MTITVIISTEFDAQHRDWVMPEDWKDLSAYLEEHDEGNSPFGSFVEQAKAAVENVEGAGDPDYRVNLVLPVDGRDLNLWAVAREAEDDQD